jgi:hypothetical protein
MKNLKVVYSVLTFVCIGFFFGSFMAKGTIDLTIGGLLLGLFILPAILDLKFNRNSTE